MDIILSVFLVLMSGASFYKDWYRPEYLKDKDGNPPVFPMPYVTMMACLGTAATNLLMAIIAHFGVELSLAWAIVILVACIAAIVAELVPNISNWRMMNWASIALIVINSIVFVILTTIH